MVLAKPAGAIDITASGVDLEAKTGDSGTFTFFKLTPPQPPQWQTGILSFPLGYVPKYAVCLTNSASNTDNIGVNFYDSNPETQEDCRLLQEISNSPVYTADWTTEEEASGHTTGKKVEVGNFNIVPLQLEPHTMQATVRVDEATAGAGTATKIYGFYCEHVPDKTYSGNEYELTSREDASHWTPMDEGESCSAYLMQFLWADNMNKIAYKTRQVWSFVL
jgi:hypothetical protein